MCSRSNKLRVSRVDNRICDFHRHALLLLFCRSLRRQPIKSENELSCLKTLNEMCKAQLQRFASNMRDRTSRCFSAQPFFTSWCACVQLSDDYARGQWCAPQRWAKSVLRQATRNNCRSRREGDLSLLHQPLRQDGALSQRVSDCEWSQAGHQPPQVRPLWLSSLHLLIVQRCELRAVSAAVKLRLLSQ